MWMMVQEKILAESAAMVPDTQQRLKGALKDLQDFMVCWMFNLKFCNLRMNKH